MDAVSIPQMQVAALIADVFPRQVVLNMQNITHSKADPNKSDIPAQLDKLRGLQNGWLDGEGKAPPPSGLDWLSGVFMQHYPDGADPPYTYPTPEGGVNMEWSIGKREISLEIDLVNHTGEWLDYNVDTDDSIEKKLALGSPRDWKWVGRQITLAKKMSK